MQGLLPHFIDDQFGRGAFRGEMDATILFADLQGFTSHTETLMKEGKVGAERLSLLLNNVFGSAATAIHRHGGFIPYFAGDAFAGIFPDSLPPSSALFAAEEIRRALARLKVEIPLRIGIDQGRVQWQITPESPHTWTIRGPGIAGAVQVQTMAPAGEIFISREVFDRVRDLPGLIGQPVHDWFTILSLDAPVIPPAELLSEVHTASFVPAFLSQRFSGGEFRRVTSLFISFPEDLIPDDLDRFLQLATAEVYRREGYYKETDFTDKGGLLVAFFGAPVDTGESRRMAIQTALALVDHPALADIPLKAGISTGPAFCGLAGNDFRRQYIIASRSVNLAARLSLKTGATRILSDEATLTGLAAGIRERTLIRAKGFQQEIPVCAIAGLPAAHPQGDVLYGRMDEKRDLLHLLRDPEVRCIEIIGDPGIGKSFLSRVLCRMTGDETDWLPIVGNPANTAPFADLDETWAKDPVRMKDPEVARLVKEVTEARLNPDLSPRIRFERLEGLYQALLDLVRPGLPLGLHIEHWKDLDHATRQLILHRIGKGGVRVLTTGREPIPECADMAEAHHRRVILRGVGRQGIRELATAMLAGPVSEPLIDMLDRAGNGNPFYTEQLLLYLKDHGLLHQADDQWTVRESELELGGTFRDILMARLDRLERGVREVLKSAAVIGTSFELPILAQVLDEVGESTGDLPDRLHHAEQAEILRTMDELNYIFRHSLLREVIYDVQMDSRLRQLHGLVVRAMETIYAGELGPHYAALADHAARAGWPDRQARYLREAARFALHQYQNKEAVDFFDQALDAASVQDRASILLERLPAFEALGQWNDALQSLDDNAFNDPQLTEQQSAEHLAARGHFRVLLGDYGPARTDLEQALNRFEQSGFTVGIRNCYRDLATLYFRQGDYGRAETTITRSMALADDPSRIDNALVMSLALIRMNQGRYVEAEHLLFNDLLIRHQTGEKQCLISLYTNLGIVQSEMGHYTPALQHLEKGLDLARDLGSKLWMSIALGTRGFVREQTGDWSGALEDFREDLRIGRDLQDIQGESIALELLGSLELRMGDWDPGDDHIDQSLDLALRIGYKKGQVKALSSKARAALLRERPAEALDWIREATRIAEDMNNRKLLAGCLLTSAWIALEADANADVSTLVREAESDVLQWDDPSMHRELILLTSRLLPSPDRWTAFESLRETYPEEEGRAEAAWQLVVLKQRESDRSDARKRFQHLRERWPSAFYSYRLNQLGE